MINKFRIWVTVWYAKPQIKLFLAREEITHLFCPSVSFECSTKLRDSCNWNLGWSIPTKYSFHIIIKWLINLVSGIQFDLQNYKIKLFLAREEITRLFYPSVSFECSKPKTVVIEIWVDRTPLNLFLFFSEFWKYLWTNITPCGHSWFA